MRHLAALLALFVAGSLSAQQPVALPPNDEQTQLFRGLFHFHKIEPESLENLDRGYDYSKLIVVVYGSDPQSRAVTVAARSALANGGAVLVATDSQLQLSAYFPRPADVSVTGKKVLHTRPSAADQGLPDRPLASPKATGGANPFAAIGRIATIGPSYLEMGSRPAGLGLEPVLEFAGGATVSSGGRFIKYADLFSLPFGFATTDGSAASRCAILADQDVFSNQMIYTSGRERDATDNLKFANNLVQWLKGSDRTKCLFVENGQVVGRFDEFEYAAIPLGPNIPPPPVPNIDIFDRELQQKLADAANQGIDSLQKNDVMNRELLYAFNGPGTLYAVLAVILTFVAYAIVRRKAIAARMRAVFRPIPRDPAMLGPDVPVGSLEHRRLELLRSSDYGPVVRQFVRQLFQERGLPSEYTGHTLPQVEIDVRRPKFLREAIHSLWAVVRTTAPIGYGRWKQLEPLLAAVRAAAADDRWRFVPPSPRDAA